MTGTTFLHYEITGKLGEGGMGVVYRARDNKLGRDVALKVLPNQFAGDPQRMGRFSREARVLASLNHPSIAAIHGLEESNGVRALVMELVEGPTLEDRIAEGPIPLDEALPLARQISEALEYAHDKGVIHRDLKPANVKLTDEGKVKVLDFGLAKAMDDEPDSGDPAFSPTLTMGATRAGVILGTAGYMSPEQARGRPADRRSDIWAFGVVLYEMLTGRGMFTGETISDTLAGVLRAEIDLTALPEGTPAAVRRVLRRCLERDRNKRLQAIGDARIELEEAAEPEPAAAAARPSRLPWVVAGAAAALAGLAWVHFSAAPAEVLLRKLAIPVPQLTVPSGSANSSRPFAPFALSPDGGKLAYVSRDRLWIRDFTEFDPVEVPGSEGAANPFWSPDGAHIGYFAQGSIWQTPVSGGNSRQICKVPPPFSSPNIAGAVWTRDGRILFTSGFHGLFAVPVTGGEPTSTVEPDPETEGDYHDGSALPDDGGILFVVHRKQGIDTLAVWDGKEKTRKIVFTAEGETLRHPVYASSGHILYPQADGVWALPFSLSALEATGEPFRVYPNAWALSAAGDGTLALTIGDQGAIGADYLWRSRSGQVLPPAVLTAEPGRALALSPDGRRLAYMGRGEDIWVIDLTRGVRTRLTENGSSPVWSPDGEQVAFSSARANNLDVFVRRADGVGAEQPVVATADPEAVRDWSRDGRYLLLTRGGSSGVTLSYVERSADGSGWGEPQLLVSGAGRPRNAKLSPDGRYFAYQSNETGSDEIYVRPFPRGERRWTVSGNGGQKPRWSRDGRELYYVSGDTLIAVAVSTAGEFSMGKAVQLFESRGLGEGNSNFYRYDVAPSGQRFLVAEPVEQPEAQGGDTIHIIQNWFAEFRDRSVR